MRAYLFLAVALGMFGALAGHLHADKPVAPAPADRSLVSDREEIAEIKAKSEPRFDNQDGSIELQRQDDGHFYADVRVNGTYVHMLVDTGASGIALSREDAQSAGIATSIGMNDVVAKARTARFMANSPSSTGSSSDR